MAHLFIYIRCVLGFFLFFFSAPCGVFVVLFVVCFFFVCFIGCFWFVLWVFLVCVGGVLGWGGVCSLFSRFGLFLGAASLGGRAAWAFSWGLGGALGLFLGSRRRLGPFLGVFPFLLCRRLAFSSLAPPCLFFFAARPLSRSPPLASLSLVRRSKK